VIWHTTHRRRRRMVQSYSLGGDNVPSYVGTLAPPDKYNWTYASFGLPESTTQTANRSVQPLLHSSQQKVPILYNGRPFPKIAPFHEGISTSSNLWFLGPVRAHIQQHHDRFNRFLTGDCKVTLYFTRGRPFPWGDPESGPPSNTWFSEPTRVLNPNDISIGSVVLQGSLVWQTDRETDRPRYSVGNKVPTRT